MSSISAGTTSTTTLIHSGDTTGSLVFKTNDTGSGGTTAMTIDTSQNVACVGNINTATGKKYQVNSTTVNALAWANFNGSTASVRSSYNVTSVTRNSTGDYTVTFTTALTDANYALTGTAGSGNTTNASVCPNYAVASPTTSAVRFQVTNSANVLDLTYVNIAIFGN